MADVELVIKIPEEMYKNIQSRDWKNGGRCFSEEWKAIHNGVQIPKGHGRLVDEKEVYKKFNCRCLAGVAEEVLKETQTIIEADESEDKE